MSALADGEIGALIGLLSLPEMGPARLGRLLAAHDGPTEVMRVLIDGRVSDTVDLRCGAESRRTMLDAWRSHATAFDAAGALATHRSHGIEILDPGHPDWPEGLVDDPEPPVLLFVRGDRASLATVGVAVVGTRRCTAGGAAVARDLGRDLADVGVCVISGLALGIDGAAHRGALAAGGPTIGVVATGLDVVYPPRHRSLWDEMAAVATLVSESPLGTPPTRWRFPARNRLMAAMAEVVIVVESGRSGGSMRTVESAMERGTDVAAVPGSVRAPQSAGPNQLLADGVGVVRDVDDVLAILGSRAPSSVHAIRAGRADEPPDGTDGATGTGPIDRIADLVSTLPVSLDRLVAASGSSFADVATRLTMLEVDGVVERVAQGYRRRVR